jgi:hypothetical protein
LFALCATALAQTQGEARSRDYPFPEAPVKAALQNLGAYTGNRLPSLDGFINMDGVQAEQYQRPYYEYKIEVASTASGKTQVRVQAKVSAWFEPSGSTGKYQSLESNGRLESDLLDRLSEYLENKSSDPSVLQVKIQQALSQKEDAKNRVAQLQIELENLKNAAGSRPEKEYASITRSQTAVLTAPVPSSKVLLRAQSKDEFEVLEQQNAWLHVALDDSQTGWIKRSQVKLGTISASSANASAPEKTEFTVIREASSDFSGDWTPLKGKNVLYIWARPEGSGLNLSGNKLQFVRSVFVQRYEEISHASQNSVAGVVVIFLDNRGGVAAASLDNIRLLADGSLSPEAFFKTCSLDPPSAFKAPSNSN